MGSSLRAKGRTAAWLAAATLGAGNVVIDPQTRAYGVATSGVPALVPRVGRRAERERGAAPTEPWDGVTSHAAATRRLADALVKVPAMRALEPSRAPRHRLGRRVTWPSTVLALAVIAAFTAAVLSTHLACPPAFPLNLFGGAYAGCTRHLVWTDELGISLAVLAIALAVWARAVRR